MELESELRIRSHLRDEGLPVLDSDIIDSGNNIYFAVELVNGLVPINPDRSKPCYPIFLSRLNAGGDPKLIVGIAEDTAKIHNLDSITNTFDFFGFVHSNSGCNRVIVDTGRLSNLSDE